MKFTLVVEDTITIAGPGIDVSCTMEPPLPSDPTPEQMQEWAGSHAIKLGTLAAQTIRAVTELAGERANAMPTSKERN